MALQEWPLPIRGLSKSTIPDNETPGTSAYMRNVRPYDVLEKRLRLGQRPGLKKWCSTQVGDQEQPVVAMCIVTSVV